MLAPFIEPVQRFFNEPMPKGVGWRNTLGSALLACVVLQVVTGILLAVYYSPNAEVAYESVQYIERHVLFGSVIRGVHYFAASAFVILIFLHILRTFFAGAYKAPRELNWVLGVILLLIVLGFAFTGYLLPWDMKAYFATKVGINIGGMAPVLGPYVVKLMQGGSEMGTLTLNRFYALHVIVLPLALLLVVFGHIYLIRRHGPTPPGKQEGEPISYSHRFFPLQLLKDSTLALVLVAVVLFLAVRYGAPLEAKADPTDTSYVPRPDWYFYSLFQLLKIFEGRLEVIGGIVLPTIFILLLFALPFLDRSPARRLAQRPLAAGAGAFCAFAILALTTWGAYEAAGDKAARLAAASGAETAEAALAAADFDVETGEQLYAGLKCAGCHDQLSRGDNIPPGLEFSGNKYRFSWLVDYLREPHRIRWQNEGERPIARMPDFELSEREAGDLAAYMLTLTVEAKFPPIDFEWAEADSDMVLSGETLFGDYGCGNCHRIGDRGDRKAPALTHAGSKLQEEYMYHLIKSPHTIVPETPMKDSQLEAIDVEDLVAYLRTLK